MPDLPMPDLPHFAPVQVAVTFVGAGPGAAAHLTLGAYAGFAAHGATGSLAVAGGAPQAQHQRAALRVATAPAPLTVVAAMPRALAVCSALSLWNLASDAAAPGDSGSAHAIACCPAMRIMWLARAGSNLGASMRAS